MPNLYDMRAGKLGENGQGLAKASLSLVWQRMAQKGRRSFSSNNKLSHGTPGHSGRSSGSKRNPGSQRPCAEPWRRCGQPCRAKQRRLWRTRYQPPEPATEEKDLIELLRTFEDKLPSEVIAALPTKPTLGPVEEGREVADKYAEAVRELRILGRES